MTFQPILPTPQAWIYIIEFAMIVTLQLQYREYTTIFWSFVYKLFKNMDGMLAPS